MTVDMNSIFAIVVAITGAFVSLLIALVGWFARNAFREFADRIDQIAEKAERRGEAMEKEMRGIRHDLSAMTEAQAIGHERFTAMTEKILDLKSSDEKLWEQMADAISRLTRLEERSAYAVEHTHNNE